MSYNPARDPFTGWSPEELSAPAKELGVVTPDDTNQLTTYARALRVFVPAATGDATVRVVPLMAAADTDTVDLKFGEGLNVANVMVRKVLATGLTAGVIVQGVTK